MIGRDVWLAGALATEIGAGDGDKVEVLRSANGVNLGTDGGLGCA